MKLDSLPAISAPLPWQAAEWARMSAQGERGQLPHALLLHGPAGIGKARFALAMARALLCAAPRDGLNCGECHACSLSAVGNHGDLLWVQPEETRGKPSRFIKVDQVRAAIQFAQQTPSLGRRQVLVFEQADSLTLSGFNALLKSLEEPSAGTYLVLVCDRMHTVPATIRSRCQLQRFATPPRAAALEWLARQTGDGAATAQLLELAGGSPLRAAELLDSGEAEGVVGRRLALRALLAGQAEVTSVWGLWGERDTGEFLDQVAAELRHLVRGLAPADLAGPRGREALNLIDEVMGLQRAVSAGANPGKQLVVDVMLAKCHKRLGAAAAGW
jgi:DNA polymerase-3 subunit delta'